ncbi:SusC/RagA family TonB-linked outer membrane protein [Labilibaculum sp. DW002]|uniref:SusC/RagA family TonB-linked outer membrane protein n=1 Tax=Paralabilibaculum antarcticum TaxID=2912572 RepID=A0ABT5VUE5_9BACT|nr:SusC/RagA family TonB-linked outer membrane protein [Labilibaculum sp. DW002]MDE5419044.1 SusC/RagA family TonB-linked outer membrane protein [Labilibaculum sp. DW002]
MKKKSFLRYLTFGVGLKCASFLLVLILFNLTANANPFFAISTNETVGAKNQQARKITGKVLDESGISLPGVSVIVKGTTMGTITTIDGDFAINVSEGATTLLLTFVGMENVEIDIQNQDFFEVKMKASSIGLDELVVVGYGAQKKATMSGSVAQVKGDEMLKGKGTSSAALAIQGEIPGVQITRTSARPGNENIDIKIRGDISVNNISPLILLDGLQIPEWQLSTINPNDIETYSVIKDGAAAIFGTKAAGGVLLITTKKGKAGKIKVEYNADLQFTIPYEWPITNLQELGELWTQAGSNDAITFTDGDGNEAVAGGTYKFFSKDQWEKIANGEIPTEQLFGAFDFKYADTDYFDEVYGVTTSQRHNISISGGSDKATFRTSLGYANDRSTMDVSYDGAKKYNFRTNLNYKVNDMVTADLNVSYDNRQIDVPTQGVGETVNDPWLWPVYNPDGEYYHLWGARNVVGKLKEGGRTETEQEIFRLGGKITLNLGKYVKGLSLNYQGNMMSRRNDKTARKTTTTVYDWTSENVISEALSGTSVDIDLSKIFFQNHVFQANYKRSFGNHNLGVMVGMTAEEETVTKYEMYRKNMASDELDALNTGDATTQTNGGSAYATGLVSYLGRVNYDYNGIYLLEVSGRRDGSSRLHEDKRWKNFLGASTGVRLSEMDFLKDGLFQNLKIRASYGETGSTTGIGAYDYFSTISTGETYFGSSPSINNTAWIKSMTSTDRTWERVAKTNFGVDFTTLNSRLSGTFEYFKHQNKDMLISITYPQVLGASAPKTNSGDFNNHGWEVSLKWRDKIGELKYKVGVSMWDSKSEVTHMEGAQTIKHGVNTTIEGKPLNAIYAYRTDGIFQNEAEVLAYYNDYGFTDPSDQLAKKSGTALPDYRSNNRLSPGSYRKVDENNDGIINDDDLYYFGDANPHYNFGINLSAEWRNFDFSAFFQGVGQQYIVRSGTLAYPFRAWWMNQNNTWAGDTWTPENTGADYPAITNNGKRKGWNYGTTNDNNVINAWYMRAKVISLGYTVPKELIQNIGLERVRVSVTGNDIFTFSNVKDGLDPENGSSAHGGNVDPFNSSLIFSIQATF